MPTPDFIIDLRAAIGTAPLWLSGVTAVVLRGEEVLLIRRSDNGMLAPVSGILEPSEEPAVGAIREVYEEAGIVAEVESLAWVHVMDPVVYGNGDRAQYLDLVFRCRYVSGEPQPLDGEATEVMWRRLDDLDDLESDDHRERIRVAALREPATRFER
ncbi:NUDIX domain-containing protein [Glaciibacter flavus]|uniref:NUDIX domain-containing protein n=1 Tax=Orlajensenia flava TaxID=2565934 RepID=A0A4S4FX50_9MICO|nr:NUDIX domain-containing protein [Glaciibacter flavus]THG34226.1 NUDIX domain-containing protein [Glaciibacter flavus]